MLQLLFSFLLILNPIHCTLPGVDILLTLLKPLYEVNRHWGVTDPEAHMTVKETIIYHGYPYKEYNVTTDDGYILTIQRIPFGKKGRGKSPRKPVLMQHGFMCSSASWISNTPDKNLPYILADAGYDVWLGNIRGTLFGKQHKTLKTDSDKFWNYSFHEMALHDIPAIIDMILHKTGFKHIYYIGHSMGTTMMFVMLSLKPKYNDIIKGVFALAPVARMDHIRSPIRLVAPFTEERKWLEDRFGSRELFVSIHGKLFDFFAETICDSPAEFICDNIIFLISGFSLDELNTTRLPVFLHHTPAGTSVKNFEHYAQLVQQKKFQYYDFGEKGNKINYGQHSPPVYNLTKIRAPVLLFWSDNDYLADPEDVAWLAKQLPNLVLNYRVPKSTFSHMDFLWAIHSKSLVYDKVLNEMNSPKLWKGKGQKILQKQMYYKKVNKN